METPEPKEKMHQNKNKKQDNMLHVPVLLTEVLESLSPKSGDLYLDLTAGYGGHAREVIARTQAAAVLVDRDSFAIDELTAQFTGQNVEILHQDFYSASQALVNDGRQFDLVLADLGVSSPHLNEPRRGFSLNSPGPLDMRMDTAQTLTAEQVVNSYSEQQLTSILKEYGEEPKAGQIARLIIGNRPFKDTVSLAAVVAKAWPGHSKVHPATRTFQALRIFVNDELRLLEDSLPLWLQLVAPGGRIAIISFHSLEDRIVKRVLQEASGNRFDADFRLLTKRPITAGHHEIVFNPRARSAKLRAAVKIKNEREA